MSLASRVVIVGGKPMSLKWDIAVWMAFRARNLTRADRDVLLTLRTYARSGRAWPSQATLARKARTCAKTVCRAMRAGQGAGLVAWTKGRRWLSGGSWKRGSNTYTLLTPDLMPLAPGVRMTTGHFSIAGEKQDNPLRFVPRTIAEQLTGLGIVVPRGTGSLEFQRVMGW